MLTIRRAGIEDIEEVVRLRVEFLIEGAPDDLNPESVNADHIRQYVADKLPSGEYVVWLAEDDGQIVGTGGLVFFHRPPGFSPGTELNAMVFSMYTIPERRRQGVATAILRHMTDYVKTTPAHHIILYATEMGRPVYERFGFTPSIHYMTLNV